MLKHIDVFNSRLATTFTSTNLSIKLRATPDVVDKLNALQDGDHVYLVLSHHSHREVIKYTHTEKVRGIGGIVTLPVGREQFGTRRTTWAAGTCVRSEVLFEEIRELITEQCCKGGRDDR